MLVIVLLIMLVSSCCTKEQKLEANNISKRIIVKEEGENWGVSFYIIEVDGIEYIATYHVGICPLVK